MWMLPLYLHVNQKSDYDMMMIYIPPLSEKVPHQPCTSPSHLPYYTPPHYSGRVLWFHVGRPCVCPSIHPSVVRPSVSRTSIRPSVFRFQMIT